MATVKHVTDASKEQHRWGRLLGLQVAALGIFLGAALGSGIGWFVLPALLALPIAGPLTLVYLAMSSDANGQSARS